MLISLKLYLMCHWFIVIIIRTSSSRCSEHVVIICIATSFRRKCPSARNQCQGTRTFIERPSIALWQMETSFRKQLIRKQEINGGPSNYLESSSVAGKSELPELLYGVQISLTSVNILRFPLVQHRSFLTTKKPTVHSLTDNKYYLFWFYIFSLYCYIEYV